MKIYLRNFANNPHVVFVAAWTLCMVLYSLGGAGILPKLSFGLFIFLLSFLLLFIITGFFLKKVNFLVRPAKPVNINYKVMFLLNNIIFLPNFLFSGIPVFNGVRDDFGIPGVISIAISLNAFTCVCCYYMYLTTKKKKFLWYVAYCLFIFAIIISRGFILLTVVTMFFLWMNIKNPTLTFKKIMLIGAGLLFILYLFGVAGNLRTMYALNTMTEMANPDNPDPDMAEYSNDVILELGNASDVFDRAVPGEFFWSYLYLTSPLANLQYNINITNPPFTMYNFYLVVVNETMFDFISKRLDVLHKGFARKTPVLIIDALTVCTTLAGSYASAGWGGMFYLMLFLWLLPVFYLLLISKNPLAVIGVSTLCTVYLFSIFDNMFVLSGLTMQIFYPIILMKIQKIRFDSAAPLESGADNVAKIS